MRKIEFWRDIDLDPGRFRIAVDANGRVYAGWHQFGGIPRGGRRDEALRPDLVTWLDGCLRPSTRRSPKFPIPDGPPFYRACWQACWAMPPGVIWNYGQLAVAAGRPRAARAAGSAMRENPTPVLIPCHRILPATGGCGGFAGQTRASDPAVILKRKLLKLEGYPPVKQSVGGILSRQENGVRRRSAVR